MRELESVPRTGGKLQSKPFFKVLRATIYYSALSRRAFVINLRESRCSERVENAGIRIFEMGSSGSDELNGAL